MATAAEVDMMNQALFLLGNEPVADLSDAALDQSVAAVKILRVMETSRDAVLSRHGWVCALEYRTLAPTVLNGYQNFRYPTVYQLPGEALKVWEIAGEIVGGHESGWGPRWQVGSWETDAGARMIIRAKDADAALNVAYVRRCNWAALSRHLKDAIAWDMAARAAYSVTGDDKRRQSLAQEAEQMALKAISAEGTDEGGQPPLAPSIPAMLRNMAR